MRVTRKQVNAALAEAGFEGVEIVKGNGYWYFSGGDAPNWYRTAVYTMHLSDLSVPEWVQEARECRDSQRW